MLSAVSVRRKEVRSRRCAARTHLISLRLRRYRLITPITDAYYLRDDVDFDYRAAATTAFFLLYCVIFLLPSFMTPSSRLRH